MHDILEILAWAAVTATFGGLLAANAIVVGLKVSGRGDLAVRFMTAIRPLSRHFSLTGG